MIVSDGALVAHIGGPSGAALRLAQPGGAFRVVAEYGRDPKTQAAAQRRLLLTAGNIFVLEPAEGVFFDEDPGQVLRVRRLDREGNELDQVEGPGEEGPAQLAYLAVDGDDATPLQIHLYGIDPASGRPWRTQRSVPALGWGRINRRRFIPVWHAGDLYVPLRGSPLHRFRGAEFETFPIVGERVEVIRDRVVCLGRREGAGIWIDGAWHPLAREKLHPGYKDFAGPGVVEHPGGGLIALCADGGDLPGVEGAPPARLREGLYSGFVSTPEGLWAVEESTAPRQIPVVFD